MQHILLIAFLFLGLLSEVSWGKAKPTEAQIKWQELEMISIIHFNPNSFLNIEWGDGTASPNVFNPSNKYNPEQWMKVLKSAGFKGIIAVSKHHDGMAMWPTKYTDYNISESHWKNGQGDLMKDMAAAAKKVGLEWGIYLSPWDRNYPVNKDYDVYFKNQLKEMIEEYGEPFELWFDGAGADNFKWQEHYDYAKKLAPNMVIFNTPDIRWGGNEKCTVEDGDEVWSPTIYSSTKFPKFNGQEVWNPVETDCSYHEKWFFHNNSHHPNPRGLGFMKDVYFKSVGNNAILNMGIPPNRDGLISSADSIVFKQFGEWLETIFKYNLAERVKYQASNVRGNQDKFSGAMALDENPRTFWTVDEQLTTGSLEVELKKMAQVNMVMIQEHIKNGQNVSEFQVDAWLNNSWSKIAEGTTIGYKRIVNFPDVYTNKVRLRIVKSRGTFEISHFSVYDQSARTVVNSIELVSPSGYSDIENKKVQVEWKITGNVPKVKIEYSKNSGVTWETIATVPGAAGQFPISEVEPSVYALFRVSDANDASVYDVSELEFEVLGASHSTPIQKNLFKYANKSIQLFSNEPYKVAIRSLNGKLLHILSGTNQYNVNISNILDKKGVFVLTVKQGKHYVTKNIAVLD